MIKMNSKKEVETSVRYKKPLLMIMNVGVLVLLIINSNCNKNTTKPDDFISPDSNIVFNRDIREPIFLKNCANRIGCHISGEPAAGLDLETPSPTFQTNSNRLNLILPGNPEYSVLYRVLWDNYPPDQYDTRGISRMPKDQPPLSDEKIKAIRIWIKEGAKTTTSQ